MFVDSEEATLYTAADRGRVQESFLLMAFLALPTVPRAESLAVGLRGTPPTLGTRRLPRAPPLVSGVTSDRHLVLLVVVGK